MAVTSIYAAGERADRLIRYVCDPGKTCDAAENGKVPFVTCIGCTGAGSAAEEFEETRLLWGKSGGRSCYHGRQSFDAGELDAKTAHEIGVKLAQRLWGRRFQTVIATHCNTGHYHNHFVLNSVSDTDGLKFEDTFDDYRLMRGESDRLCAEYGLSVIEKPGKGRKSYAEWKAEQNGEFTVRGGMREAIDICAAASVSFPEFLDRLASMGYETDLERRNPALRQAGSGRFFRFDSLGSGYTVDVIKERVRENRNPEYPYIPEQDDPGRIFPDGESVSSMSCRRLYGIYVAALELTARRPDGNRRMYLMLRGEHRKTERYKAQLRILAENSIDSVQDLIALRERFEKEYSENEDLRREWRNALRRSRRSGDAELARQAYYNIDIANRKLAQLRADIRACGDIAENSPGIRERLGVIRTGELRKRRSDVKDEYLIGSGGSGSQDDAERN